MEEALWDLEDKLKLSTQGAFLILASTISFVIALAAICTLIIILLKRKKAFKNKIAHQELEGDDDENDDNIVEIITNNNNNNRREEEQKCCRWISLKSVLMGSVRWSKACKWKEEKKLGSQRKQLFGLEMHHHHHHHHLHHCHHANGGLNNNNEVGRQSHNSVSAVWQRPILRGEKCELPSFSGLILYDEKGRLVSESENENGCNIEGSNQEKEAVTVRTTLRDLL